MPLREIILSEGSGEPPLPVYDTSGPLPTLPSSSTWKRACPRPQRLALERGGLEAYDGREVKPEDNAMPGATSPRLPDLPPAVRGVGDSPVTQYEFARRGIITKEMIYVAERENLGRKAMIEGAARPSPMARASARRSRPSSP